MRRAVLLVFVLCLPFFIAQAASDNALATVWRSAALYVPASALPDSATEQEDTYTFFFTDEGNDLRHEVIMRKNPLAVDHIITSSQQAFDDWQVTLAPYQIAGQILEDMPGAHIYSVVLEQEGGRPQYAAAYVDSQGGLFYKSHFHPGSGQLLKRTALGPAPGEPQAQTWPAIEQALKAAGGGGVLDIALAPSAQVYAYQLQILQGNQVVTVQVAHGGEAQVISRAQTAVADHTADALNQEKLKGYQKHQKFDTPPGKKPKKKK